jgi:AraC-like DNA-binding protein
MLDMLRHGVYGYRFEENPDQCVFQLFCTGYDKVTSRDYSWDGLTRQDGPLYLFQYTLSGYGEIRIAGSVHTLPPNRAFMVKIPSDHHYYLPEGSDHWEFIFLLIRPYHVESLWDDIIRQAGHTPTIPPDGPALQALCRLYREASSDQIQDRYQASSLVYHFMMEMYRSILLPADPQAQWPTAVREAIQYMSAHYHEPIGLEQIASHVGLSKYHFNRLFAKTTGRTPLQHLTQIRLERAIDLIRYSTSTLEEIAWQIGYTSGSYLSKLFQRHFGLSPSDFRHGQGSMPIRHPLR